MATANKFNDFTNQLCLGKHVFDGSTHTFNVALSNTLPTAANTIFSNITEISAGNGYTAGGAATTITNSASSGTMTVSGTQVVTTATGAVGPFRYVVLYNVTQTTPLKPLVAWWDYGSSISLANTDTFTVKFNNATPGTIFTVV